MEIMKRLLCIGVASLLLCTSLTACTPKQEAPSTPEQEKISGLDLIKREWQRYVVDRTEEIDCVAVGRMSISSGLVSTHKESVVDGVLNICQTLNVVNLIQIEAPTESIPWPDLTVCLPINVTSHARFFQISIYKNGEAYMCLVEAEEEKDDTRHWAYIDNWPVYDQLYEYSDY